MFGFAEDVVHLGEASEVAVGKAFLVWDEDVGAGSADPAGEDALHEEVGIEALFLREESEEGGGSAAVADGDLVPGCLGDFADEVDIAVEADAVGAGDDVEVEVTHFDF